MQRVPTEPRSWEQLTPLQQGLVRLQFGEDVVAAGRAWIFDGGLAFVTFDPAARPDDLPTVLQWDGEA